MKKKNKNTTQQKAISPAPAEEAYIKAKIYIKPPTETSQSFSTIAGSTAPKHFLQHGKLIPQMSALDFFKLMHDTTEQQRLNTIESALTFYRHMYTIAPEPELEKIIRIMKDEHQALIQKGCKSDGDSRTERIIWYGTETLFAMVMSCLTGLKESPTDTTPWTALAKCFCTSAGKKFDPKSLGSMASGPISGKTKQEVTRLIGDLESQISNLKKLNV